MSRETIALAAGCFWGVQHLIDRIPGVLKTRCGYIGGRTEAPSYREVCSGETGHAEAVEVEFDNDKISLEEILDYFWRLHDPTQLNRQGVDVGTQYRSAIFCYSDGQAEVARASKEKFDVSGVFPQKSVTEILPADDKQRRFYEAEEYHQKYFERNNSPVCHIMRPR